MLKEEEIRESLEGKNILIIEDDESLSKRLISVLKYYGVEVAIKYCVDSGLGELKECGLDYHLIVVDVMLNQTEEESQQIQSWRKKVFECVEVLMQEDEADPKDDEFRKRLQKAREQRRTLLNQITSLIRKLGGIEMIEEWLGSLTDNEKKKRPAILYLAAVGNEEAIERGKKAAKDRDVEWLIKPVTGSKLIRTTVKLMK